jgi:ribosomal protein S4
MGADSEETKRGPQMTPYMQMTYYPLERRLDTAIFRALFASSVRQARQFVVHGLVKVNGKKVHHRSSSTTAWTR